MGILNREYMRVNEAASYLGVHKDTLKNWEEQGLILPLRFGRRRDRLYSTKMLDKFFEEQVKETPRVDNE